MNKVILHVDIDAFYASVEQRDRPDLAGKPVIVGALPGHRGVVSACSYEARRFGIHSAMPISQAYSRCPEGTFLPVRMKRYIEISQRIMEKLHAFSPSFRQLSIDEAVLDLSGTDRIFGPARLSARRIKDMVLESEGLVLSVGIAPNAYLAKLASEAGKPDGLFEVKPGDEEPFLDSLELKHLWGVGGKTLQRLADLNIDSIPRLRSIPMDSLAAAMGKGVSHFLFHAVRGQNPGIHSETPKSRSVSHEMTFEIDRKNPVVLHRFLLELAQQVMRRLIDGRLRSKTVCLKLRLHDFTTVTARHTLRHWITSSEELHRIGIRLLDRRWDGHTPVRLVGLGVSTVVSDEEPEQAELFVDSDGKKKQVEEAVNRLQSKGAVLTRASLLKKNDK